MLLKYRRAYDSGPYERVVQILQDYICNDAEAAEIDYVKDVLESVCGVTKEEAEALGFGYLFDK